jgi:PIN domain nuclease of toxin-antitoxin system
VRLLLDTNILVPLVDGAGRSLPQPIVGALADDGVALWASAVSIWEVAIKHRLGKLPLPCPLADWPEALAKLNIAVIPIRTAHVIQPLDPDPPLRDPYDRLLLAICAAERMQLLTTDRLLAAHPLAWRDGAA